MLFGIIFFQTGSLSGSYFSFVFFFFLSNVRMVAMLIILILFIPNLETVVQFLTMKQWEDLLNNVPTLIKTYISFSLNYTFKA